MTLTGNNGIIRRPFNGTLVLLTSWVGVNLNSYSLFLFLFVLFTQFLVWGLFVRSSAFQNTHLYRGVSWVNIQYYRSMYPDTSQSVVMLTPQHWVSRMAAITTILKSFVWPSRGSNPQPPAPDAEALQLHRPIVIQKGVKLCVKLIWIHSWWWSCNVYKYVYICV